MITLKRAIKELERTPELGLFAVDPIYERAAKLGIEALKGIQSCRQYPECPFTELLLEETKG